MKQLRKQNGDRGTNRLFFNLFQGITGMPFVNKIMNRLHLYLFFPAPLRDPKAVYKVLSYTDRSLSGFSLCTDQNVSCTSLMGNIVYLSRLFLITN